MSPVETNPQPRHLLPAADLDGVAIRCGERTRSWADVEERAIRLGKVLETDVGPGSSWAVLAHNDVEWAEWLVGNGRAGTRLVPLNWHLTAAEMASILVDSETRLVLAGPGLEGLAAEAAALAGIDSVVNQATDYEAWLAAESSDPTELADRPAGTPMFFTGGTTGRSKGVVRSDQHLPVAEFKSLWSGWGALARKPNQGTTLITTPLYHALGFAVMAASLSAGCEVVLHERFDPIATLSAIESHRVTCTPMVPTQFIRLLKLDTEIRDRYDLSSLEWVLHSAAPCPEWAKRAMIDWFGPVLFELYGSSEGTGPAICDSHEWLAKPGTVGKASARVSYSIVDAEGNDLPPGEVGTIYCRRTDGPPAYHNDPEKTRAMVLPDGRFTVGDMGWLDEDGYLFLADRRVDLIIVGGSNVYPAEIEATLIEHPDVADVAVFGLPDPDWGERIVAVVEPPPECDPDVDGIRAWASDRLAAYKVPRRFDVVDALPREAHGKLKKRLLRDRYLGQDAKG